MSTNETKTEVAEVEEVTSYEISFIFDNKLDEAVATAKLATLKELIASNGGSFISEESPYMREIAYEMIRVQNNINIRFNEGYFGWVKFTLAASEIAAIDKKLKLDEEVVRFLIVKAEGKDVFTKDMDVVRSHNTPAFVDESATSKVSAEVNVDTTTMSEETAVAEDVKSEEVAEVKEENN